jgi:histidyl-tRNA synthetase
VDFIVFSGDVAFSGKEHEYDAAVKNLFDPLLEATGLDKSRLFIVPGNHDLDRDAFKYLPSQLQKPLTSKEEIQEWLTEGEARNCLLKPFKEYKNFIKSYSAGSLSDYASVYRLKINNIDIVEKAFEIGCHIFGEQNNQTIDSLVGIVKCLLKLNRADEAKERLDSYLEKLPSNHTKYQELMSLKKHIPKEKIIVKPKFPSKKRKKKK